MSLACGAVITAALTYAAFSTENRRVFSALLWQVTIPMHFVPPGLVLGHDNDGKPIYEGTPLMLLAIWSGVLLGIPIYGTACYFISRLLVRPGSAIRTSGIYEAVRNGQIGQRGDSCDDDRVGPANGRSEV